MQGARLVVTQSEQEPGSGKEVVRKNFEGPLRGKGTFRLDFLIYDFLGVELKKLSDSMLATLNAYQDRPAILSDGGCQSGHRSELQRVS